MQSQQKKVKWSRGETADALEERTDTGITQVSVSKMENIIADIYGNISRRPALSIIKTQTPVRDIPIIKDTILDDFSFDIDPETFVFTIDAGTYIIFVKGMSSGLQGFLIQGNKFVRKITVETTGLGSASMYGSHISAAQYNNFMIVSNCWMTDVVLKLIGNDLNSYKIIAERFKFSAPWYAPNGTNTYSVDSNTVPGLNFTSNSIANYTYTDISGETTVYSSIKTGIAASALSFVWNGPTTTYYLHKNLDDPYGYFIDTTNGADVESYITLTNGSTYTNGQEGTVVGLFPITIYIVNGNTIYLGYMLNHGVLNIKQYATYTPQPIENYIPAGSIVQFPNNGAYMRVEGFSAINNTNLLMYGSLLTPVADDNTSDSIVRVETGYISLERYEPKTFGFSNQRLYASAFYNSGLTPEQIPGYIVGSQIGRYTDFKNDYNTQSEAVSIDISTSYQEMVVNIIDYNGLKIFTDCAEYAYIDGGIIKQSENGSKSNCKPILFGSICIYADKSGGQLRAMEYEFKNNLFNSSTINQMTQEDLIFNTTSMAGFFDKEHFTGHFLYAIQTGAGIYNTQAKHSLAICNLVPGNQAAIWTRWETPKALSKTTQTPYNVVKGVVEVNNKVWFVVVCCYESKDNYGNSSQTTLGYTLAELDYENVLDFQTDEQSTDTEFKLIKPLRDYVLYAWYDSNNDRIIYSKSLYIEQGDPLYLINSVGDVVPFVSSDNAPAGPNLTINGVDYYEWDGYYTKTPTPNPTGEITDPSRQLFDNTGTLVADRYISTAVLNSFYGPFIMVGTPYGIGFINSRTFQNLEYTTIDGQSTATYKPSKNEYINFGTIPGTVSVFDGDEYKWDDTIDENGNYTKSLTDLTNPRVGFMVNATLESHPIDIQGKTYTEKKRIGKCVAVTRRTEPGSFTICDKTGYMSKDKKTVNFYGCTGMKDLVRYTIKNIKGAKFTIESLTMIIEYGTLDS